MPDEGQEDEGASPRPPMAHCTAGTKAVATARPWPELHFLLAMQYHSAPLEDKYGPLTPLRPTLLLQTSSAPAHKRAQVLLLSTRILLEF